MVKCTIWVSKYKVYYRTHLRVAVIEHENRRGDFKHQISDSINENARMNLRLEFLSNNELIQKIA